MIGSSSNFYQVGASLPVDAPSYVERQADEEFYQKLQAGDFCYVFNSRQMGKSSLRVQTMQRLQKQGTVCVAIDLTGSGKVTEEQWYGGIVRKLVKDCQLKSKLGFNWQKWWSQNREILSPVQCLSLFIEEVLLAKIQQPIVVFVDEIDKVLSQDFSLDDFFALIRFFQNQRVDNPIFQRLTFALLGVATPGDLITDKSQTPFNIGSAIELHGFQIHEVEPLIKGLGARFDNPQGVMTEILDWTGGQPFLTQKLCKFMVEESEKDKPRSVEEVVNSRIIENWESKDDPEHLRTIRDRILSSEQRAGYLLELYQQIQQQGEVTASKSVESSELRLSGLVVQRESKLRVYNRVYKQVFNKNWVETQLKNLRPYSESFKFWVASGGKDESRLLRGKALAGAEKWAKDKNLSYQDKQFLAASREKEIQEKIAAEEQASQLERERKDKEAAEQRNQVLSDANKKAKKRIRNGTVVLILALLAAVSLGVFAVRKGYEALEAQQNADKAKEEVKLAKEQVTVEQQKAQEATKKAEKERKKVKALQQKAQEAKEKAENEQHKAKQAEKNASDAKRKAIEATKQAQKAQQNADDASQEAIKARQQAKSEQRKAKEAQKNAELASRTAQAAKQEADNLQNQLNSAKEDFKIVKKDVETVQNLSKLAGELRNKNLTTASDEALRQAGLSFSVDNHNLKQAILLASMAQAYQILVNELNNETKEQKDKNIEYQKKAELKIGESLKYLNQKGNISSSQGLQIKAIVKEIQGNLTKKKNKSEALAAYQEAYDILKNNPTKTNPFADNQIITAENIESVHRRLLKLNPKQEVWDSLKEHFYAKLKNSLFLKNWRDSDIQTNKLIFFIAKREAEFTKIGEFYKFPCLDLKRIDDLWVQNSDGHFGFSVQKEIWIKTGNGLGTKLQNCKDSDLQNYLHSVIIGIYSQQLTGDMHMEILGWRLSSKRNYLRFMIAVGWLDKVEEDESLSVRWLDKVEEDESFKLFHRNFTSSYRDFISKVESNYRDSSIRGGLPYLRRPWQPVVLKTLRGRTGLRKCCLR